VWVYPTNGKGVPSRQPTQDLKFGFPYPVYSFVVDPDGKFAYSAYNWTDDQNNVNTSIVLFTIDQSTGELTNTGKVAGTWGPNQYVVMDNFVFGIYGHRLYAHWIDNGPYTYGIGYYYYPVDETTGDLGAAQTLYSAETLECGSSCAVAVSDPTSSYAESCCGSGSGGIDIGRNPNGQTFGCDTEFAFCSDNFAGLYLDPFGRNAFVADATALQTYVAHLDFSTSQLVPTSTIPGIATLDFSPDSRVVYAVDSNSITIYAFQSSTGNITASSTLADSGKVSLATATFSFQGSFRLSVDLRTLHGQKQRVHGNTPGMQVIESVVGKHGFAVGFVGPAIQRQIFETGTRTSRSHAAEVLPADRDGS
jgi:hypothetical protein